jgi:hypothetical protein
MQPVTFEIDAGSASAEEELPTGSGSSASDTGNATSSPPIGLSLTGAEHLAARTSATFLADPEKGLDKT